MTQDLTQDLTEDLAELPVAEDPVPDQDEAPAEVQESLAA